MLILLSSSRLPRYRNDILRCISAPIGGEVQFRYSKNIISKQIWDNPKEFENKRGIVCTVDLNHPKEKCPIFPVRLVFVERIFKHGSTLSISMKIKEVISIFTDMDDKEKVTSEITEFTEEIDKKSNYAIPTGSIDNTTSKGLSGSFFFDYKGKLDDRVKGNTLEEWEILVTALLQQPGYEKENFFWTVVGIEKSPSHLISRTNKLKEWNSSVELNTEYTILVYVFHPLKNQWNTKPSKLEIVSSLDLSSNYSQDLIVDSPYDLKRWSFKINSKDIFHTDRAWIQICPTSFIEKENLPKWEIILPLEIKSFRPIDYLTTIILGILLASAPILGFLNQDSLGVFAKIGATIFSLLTGIGAAFLARMGLRGFK